MEFLRFEAWLWQQAREASPTPGVYRISEMEAIAELEENRIQIPHLRRYLAYVQEFNRENGTRHAPNFDVETKTRRLQYS